MIGQESKFSDHRFLIDSENARGSSQRVSIDKVKKHGPIESAFVLPKAYRVGGLGERAIAVLAKETEDRTGI